MKWICTSLLLLLLSFNASSQSLTGIWRGYFLQKSTDLLTGRITEERYKYEIQINELPNHSIEGVTYSYKTTVFYGKASFLGIFTKQTKNVLLKENKMLDLKISDKAEACLMTCYLDYSKEGKLETLTGSYTSLNAERKSDCGDGTIYLEKVITTDFKKEDFLTKKKPENAIKAAPLAPRPSIIPKVETPSTARKPVPTTPPAKTPVTKAPEAKKPAAVIPQNNTSVKKPSAKPGAEGFIVIKGNSLPAASGEPQKISPDSSVKEKIVTDEKKMTQKPKTFPVPRILEERDNNLIETVYVDETEVQIDYYDNGEIDNDTITVYHNNELVINHGRLSYSPLSFKIKLSEENPRHVIITVANNLGDTPPNTASMVITKLGSKKRHEVDITSDEKTNAKVIIEYRAPASQKKN